MRYIYPCKPEKSSVSMHRFKTGHIDFSSTFILVKAAGYTDRVIREAVEIGFSPKTLTGAVDLLSVSPSTQ
jgi:hypothetical protein